MANSPEYADDVFYYISVGGPRDVAYEGVNALVKAMLEDEACWKMVRNAAAYKAQRQALAGEHCATGEECVRCWGHPCAARGD